MYPNNIFTLLLLLSKKVLMIKWNVINVKY